MGIISFLRVAFLPSATSFPPSLSPHNMPPVRVCCVLYGMYDGVVYLKGEGGPSRCLKFLKWSWEKGRESEWAEEEGREEDR